MMEENGSSLTSGRNWAAQTLNHSKHEWKMESEDALVQGPIDLEPFLGQRMLLTLELGQYGLLVRDDSLKALYLDGCHNLEIGRRNDQIQTNSSLLLLTTEKSLHFQWTDKDDKRFIIGEGTPVIGRCAVRIEKPARFYHRVLRHIDDLSPESVMNHLEPLVHKAFTDLLTEIASPDCDHSGGLQSLLMGLGAHQMDEFLSEHGLFCHSLAAYTAAPPVEENMDQTAGQSRDLLHN